MMKAAHPEVVAANRVNPGETLRQARESNGWSLAEVALKLNLTVNSLSNLEAGAFDKLPGHTFARGYIRAYAKLLGMDQAVLVQQFDQSTGTDSQGSSVHSLGRIEEPVRVSHTILRIVSLLLLVAVIGGGFVWWQDQTSLRTKDLVSLTRNTLKSKAPTEPPRFIRWTSRKTRLSRKARLKAPRRWHCRRPSLQLKLRPKPRRLHLLHATAPAPAAPAHSAAPVVSTPATPATPAPAVPAVPAPVVTAPVVTSTPARPGGYCACCRSRPDANSIHGGLLDASDRR
jgi:cytoskeleton protein RodZ